MRTNAETYLFLSSFLCVFKITKFIHYYFTIT